MASRGIALDTLLFVDTNVLLDFYRIRKSDVSTKYLEQLEACRDRLILGSQLEMEYKKNRQRVILEALSAFAGPDWSKATPPALLSELQAARTLEKHRVRLIAQQKKLNEKIMSILGEPSRADPVYRTLQRLFKHRSGINLSREKDVRLEIRELAQKRFILGYPPRKSGDTSIGDAINWEWILRCALDTGKHVVIVTRDTDYGVIHQGSSHLNDWLLQEFIQRVSHKRKIILTDKLSHGLKLVHAAVTQEMEKEEAALLLEIQRAAGPGDPEALAFLG
jgi:predicted nucleic acid-binding protein